MATPATRGNRRAQLIHEWDAGDERYRLIALADYTPGYEDNYLIEKLGVDGLGEPKWTEQHRWGANNALIETKLVVAIKSLLNVRSES